MRKLSTTLLLLLIPCASPAQAAERTWITDVTLVSPERLDQIGPGSVLIEDGRIIRIERGTGATAPKDATHISGKGKYLIPGLIDSHVHLTSLPGVDLDPGTLKPETVAAYFQQLPRSYLYFGYTTLIDLVTIEANPYKLADFRRAALHPDLFDCGPAVPVANGYPMSFAPPEVRFKNFPNFIYEPGSAAKLPTGYRPEDHTPAAAVARAKRAGAVCVKTFFERGFGRERNLPVLSAESMKQTRQAATESGLVLMMHANTFEAQRFAVDGGVDVLVHGMWNWGALDKNPQLPDEIKALLDRIVANKTGYQPTFQVMQGLRAYFDPAYLQLPAVRKVIPKDLLAWYRTPEGQWFKKELSDDDTPDADMQAVFDRGPIRRVRQVVAYLAARETNFLFGTDTPSAPTYGNLPGLNGYLEMRQLREAGLSLTQIFKAATLSNARAFKLDKDVGTIEVGKVANLVLMNKSPLETVEAYDSIEMVWLRGKALARESLAADR